MNWMNEEGRYRVRYCYTLRDLMRVQDSDNEDYLNNLLTPQEIRARLGWTGASLEINEVITSQEVITLWKDYIVPRNYQEIISVRYEEIEISPLSSAEDLNKVFGEFYRFLESLFIRTYKKYAPLIKLYEANESNLIKKIETTITSTSKGNSLNKGKTNEVPQVTIGEEFDNKYSNSTTENSNNDSRDSRTTTSSDSAPLYQELESVRKMWTNLYNEWADEFDTLFIE